MRWDTMYDQNNSNWFFFFLKSLNWTEGKHVVIPKELLVTLYNTKQRNNYTLNLSIIQVILSIFR